MNSKIPLSGLLTCLIGTAHTAMGVTMWLSAPDGATPQQLDLVFWFTGFGVLAIVLGIATAELERRAGYVPLTVLVGLAAVLIFGVAVVPASGFWSLLLPLTAGTIGWLRHRRQAAVTPTADVPERVGS
jgi:hypothetical protein